MFAATQRCQAGGALALSYRRRPIPLCRQDLPQGQAGLPSQLFAVLIAVFGLASFALVSGCSVHTCRVMLWLHRAASRPRLERCPLLASLHTLQVLALIEQWVLEVLERNVKRGSSVFEAGHTVCTRQAAGCCAGLVVVAHSSCCPVAAVQPSCWMNNGTRTPPQVVLAWCESSRDIAQLTRVLTQLCAANRAGGGGAVVVLTQHVRPAASGGAGGVERPCPA